MKIMEIEEGKFYKFSYQRKKSSQKQLQFFLHIHKIPEIYAEKTYLLEAKGFKYKSGKAVKFYNNESILFSRKLIGRRIKEISKEEFETELKLAVL